MDGKQHLLTDELRNAIKQMVANISKSFIVDWYTSISPTNHDFVASCENLIEECLIRFAELCVLKLDRYKTCQLVMNLLHGHVLNGKSTEKIASIESQINNFEYDICQNSVVRLFGILSNETLRKVVFITIKSAEKKHSNDIQNNKYHTAFNKLYGLRKDEKPSDDEASSERNTSALYTLVIAMLTKAAFMPIIENISEPKWLYAVIIWLCKKEEREKSKVEGTWRDHTEDTSATKNDEQVNQPCCSRQSIAPVIITNSLCNRALDLEEGIDIASANINFLNPICDSLKRPIDSIEIYTTEEMKSNNSCYILYCIRYNGLCYRHPSAGGFSFVPEQPQGPIIDRRQQTRLLSALPKAGNVNTDANSNRKSFRKVMTIKRRFREFVLLQLRLEENPKIRPYMKNIPKPTKLKAATQNIFSLPGITNIKLDHQTIKLRQRFLERFLNALNSSPFIANSYEFKEFFSYHVNSASAMSKSKSTILQVNLNKVFVDGVRSAFSLIRSTLPGEDMNSLNTSDITNPDAWLTELQQSTLKLHIQTRTNHSKMNLERLIDSKLLSLGDSPVRYCKSSSLGRSNQLKGAFYRTCNSRGGSLKANIFRSDSLSSENTSSHPIINSRSNSLASTSDSSSSPPQLTSSKSASLESIYHDAKDTLEEQNSKSACRAIQICDDVPIASKLIDIVHYSINGDEKCFQSSINQMIRLVLGKTIERFAIKLIEAALTLDNAAFCVNGITSSIWDVSDDPPLDMDNASIEEAASSLAKLIESHISTSRFIPKQLISSLLIKQLKFYISQMASKKRNKFIIYSFIVNLLDDLESQ